MKVAVLVADPQLGRALVDLLRHAGHEAGVHESAPSPCDLRIVTGAAPAEPDRAATLVLDRVGAHRGDEHPADALRAALAHGGTACWGAPLDTPLLLEVLGRAPADRPDEPGPVPDLAGAPHAWILTDVAADAVRAANAEALGLLGLPADPSGTPLDALAIGPRLRDALREEGQGLRSARVGGHRSLAAWWTDVVGRRIVCFLPALGHEHRADRQARALAELGRMAATLAHEIRNPVASLAGALELLEHEQDPEERREILEMANARLGQLSRLLEKTLTLARPLDGPRQAVDLAAVVGSAVATVRLDPQFEHVRLSVDVPDAGVLVSAYEGPLLQALINLLLNAAQAQQGRGAVSVAVEVDRGRALLRVHDDGPGIAPAKREEVFAPFYTTRTDGTGLGLAEVRRAVEAFDGEIELLDVERGACFQIQLPLAGTPT